MMSNMAKKKKKKQRIMRHLCPDDTWNTWYSRFREPRVPKSCPRCKAMLTQATMVTERKSKNEYWFYRQDAFDRVGPPPKE